MHSLVVLPGMKLRVAQLDNSVVRFNVMSTSRSISARWRGGEIHVTVPPGMATDRAVKQLLTMKDRILARRPQLAFFEGQHLDFDGFSVDVKRQSLKPEVVTLTGVTFAPVVSVGTNLDFDDLHVTELISRLLCVAAKTMAPELLLPRAKELAEGLGLKPRRWSISSGHKTLGTCKANGEIALSAINVFLTPELRDYIVYHELAHLSEMNHSSRFHALCDSYCGGRERELIKKLKTYKWPVMRL